MQYYSKEVGLRIKNLRRQRNMTQAQLAEKLCYATERQLQRIESGESSCPGQIIGTGRNIRHIDRLSAEGKQ